LVFNGGTLEYGFSAATSPYLQLTGTPSISIDRLFTLAGNGTISSDGVFGNNFLTTTNAPNNAALVFNNTGPVVFGPGAASARTLTLQGTSTGDNEIALKLVDNGSGALSITKAGGGLWLLTNTNTYTGTTTITGGALLATEGVGLPTTSLLSLGGGVLQTSGTFIRGLGTTAGTDSVQFVAGTDGFAASTSKLTVAIGGLASPTALVWGTAPFALTTLQLGSSTSAAETEFRNAIDLGNATRTINVTGSSFTSTAFSTISGVLSNSSGVGNIVLTGSGTLQLTGANTYNGTTLLNTASSTETLLVNSIGNSQRDQRGDPYLCWFG
jgi:autotransporter-associated beta strand protein